MDVVALVTKVRPGCGGREALDRLVVDAEVVGNPTGVDPG